MWKTAIANTAAASKNSIFAGLVRAQQAAENGMKIRREWSAIAIYAPPHLAESLRLLIQDH